MSRPLPNAIENQEAQEILKDNCRENSYTVPSKKLYPFQWNWDSCFTALGWATFDEPRAWREMETLFKGQWQNGKVPHIIFHQRVDSYFPGPDAWDTNQSPETSGITQPPIAATAIRTLYETSSDAANALEKVKQLLPFVFKYHQWFHEERDPNGTGLVAIYHPWESGRDNSAEWDVPLEKVSIDRLKPYQRLDVKLVDPDQRPSNNEYDRYMALVQLFSDYDYDHKAIYDVVPFKVADIGINSILLRANKDLLWLMEMVDVDAVKVKQVRTWIARQETAFDRLWSENTGTFDSLDLISNRHLGHVTSGSFLPLFGGSISEAQEKSLLSALEKIACEVKYMVPSLSPDDPSFEAKRYWRGPIWPIVNFMIAKGLSEYGHKKMADRIGQDTAYLIKEHGFVEYYDPHTGEGLGGESFSWTAAMWLAWASSHCTDDVVI